MRAPLFQTFNPKTFNEEEINELEPKRKQFSIPVNKDLRMNVYFSDIWFFNVQFLKQVFKTVHYIVDLTRFAP